MREAENLDQVFAGISDYFAPVKIGRIGALNVMCSKVKGVFHWHRHDSSEELFYIYKGRLTVHYKDRDVDLKAGVLHTVPKGAVHRTSSENGAEVFFLSPDDWIEVKAED